MISVSGNTKVFTDVGPVPVATLDNRIYTPYGERIRAERVSSRNELGYMMFVNGSAVPIIVGETHEVYGRTGDNPRPVRVPIQNLVNNPQGFYLFETGRKAYIHGDSPLKERLMAVFDSNDEASPGEASLFLKPESFTDFQEFDEVVGFYGVRAKASMKKNIIEIDAGRPVCFPLKLFAGVGPEELVNTLIDKAVLSPVLPYDKFLQIAVDTGILCEGHKSTSLRMIGKVLPMNEKIITYSTNSPILETNTVYI